MDIIGKLIKRKKGLIFFLRITESLYSTISFTIYLVIQVLSL